MNVLKFHKDLKRPPPRLFFNAISRYGLQDMVLGDRDEGVRAEVVDALGAMGVPAVGNTQLMQKIQENVKELCSKDNVIARVVYGKDRCDDGDVNGDDVEGCVDGDGDDGGGGDGGDADRNSDGDSSVKSADLDDQCMEGISNIGGGAVNNATVCGGGNSPSKGDDMVFSEVDTTIISYGSRAFDVADGVNVSPPQSCGGD